MAEILCQWVNKEVGLDNELRSEDLSLQLSNGYPYGLILSKYGLQEDFTNFHNGYTSEAKLNNFTRLEPTLRLLNIHLKPQSVSEIIEQKGHAAVQLLYRLFISLGSSRSELKRSVLQSQKTLGRVELERSERKWYQDRLRQQTLRQSDLDFEALVKLYEDRRSLEEQSMREKEERMERKEILMRQKKIAEQLTQGRLKREKQAQLYRSMKLSPIRSAARAVSTGAPESGRSHRRLRSLTPKPSKQREARDVLDQLEAFEKKQLVNLTPHGSSELPTMSQSVAAHPLTPGLDPDPPTAISDSSLDSSFVSSDPGSLAEPDTRYVARLQMGGRARIEMAQRRACRRRRILTEQLSAEESRAEQQKEELLVKRLMRQSQQEQRAATQLMQVRQNKEVIRENRANKQKQLEEQRQREFRDALDREAQLAAAERELYSEQIKQQQDLHRELLHQKERKNLEKNKAVCEELVLLFADLACKIGDYREMTDKKIPKKVFKGWKTLVLSGYSPFQNEEEEDYPPISATPPTPPLEQDREEKALLDEQDFLSYLLCSEEWSLSEDASSSSEPCAQNLILRHVVSKLYSVAFPPPAPPTPPDLPRFVFTGCIIGPPFSGKTSILNTLSQRPGVIVLDIVKLVHESIFAHNNNEMGEAKSEKVQANLETVTQSVQEKPEKSKPRPSRKKSKQFVATSGNSSPRNAPSRSSGKKEEEGISPGLDDPQSSNPSFIASPDLLLPHFVPSPRSVLGKLASNTLKRGEGLEDALLVDILVQKIRELPEATSWIIDGFPRTQKQAQLLEKQLSGYEPPSDPPKLRTSREAREGGGHKISILAQGLEHEQHAIAPRGYFHRIIFLNLPDKMAIRRGLGQQVNKRTRDKYHIEFSPAPASVKQEDLTRTNSNRLDMLQYMLATYAENLSGLRDWYGKFRNSTSLEGANTISNLTQKVEDIILSSTEPVQPQIPIIEAPDVERDEPASGEEEVVKAGWAGWEYCDKHIPNEVSEILAKLWDSAEDHYIVTCKEAFSALRQTQHISCKYIYQTREEFRKYLKGPDQKQVIVSQFQMKYNKLAADLRADRDVKAEFHQLVEDLKKNDLWEMSDKRKGNAEQEGAHIRDNGWLEDNTGLLINLFISLLQAELSRFQDTIRLIHDYYESMRSRPLSDTPAQVVVALLQLPDTQAVLESISGTAILDAQGDGEESVKGEEGEEHTKPSQRPPLMPRYEYRAELTSSKEERGTKKKLEKKPSEKSFVGSLLELEAEDRDEHQLLQAYCFTFNNVHSLSYGEYVLKEEVEQERVEKDKKETDEKNKGKLTPGKKGAAGGKGTPSGKKGAKAPQEATPEPLPSETQLSPEVLKLRKEEDRLLDEFMEAVHIEESNTKFRIEQLKSKGVSMIHELKSKVNSLYGEMDDWIGRRFKEEISSINSFCQYMHQAIENENKIKPVLNLSGTQFLIESTLITYEDPPRPRPTTPPEDASVGTLTVLQLESLVTSLSLSAEFGVISIQEFQQFLSDNSSKSDVMPEFSSEQLASVLLQISWDGHYLNWKNFIVSLARPYPLPTVETLIDTLRRFRDRCPSGHITKEEYLEEQLWFQSFPRDIEEYEIEDVQLKFDRNFMIRNAFFEIFADPRTGLLDYEDMLLYFCADSSPTMGLVAALSLVKRARVPMPEPEATSPITFTQEDLFKVLYHNQCDVTQADISQYTAPLDIVQLFSYLDTAGINQLTYAQLLSHQNFTEVLYSSSLYTLFDPVTSIFNITTAQHSETSLISEQPN